ncbi:MAG TPA: hypothetical protein VG758_10745 [Hyphomicrobiaceae bacterium]|jgi:hypothetical protein|nr:hypothetical protein [Hyphomicrobiaceae bacterium]
MPADTAGAGFGSCCEGLKDALTSEEFEPLFAVDEAGVLYMSVGLIDAQGEEEPNMVDHPVYFCPFCGTKLQTEEEVEAKLGAEAA